MKEARTQKTWCILSCKRTIDEKGPFSPPWHFPFESATTLRSYKTPPPRLARLGSVFVLFGTFLKFSATEFASRLSFFFFFFTPFPFGLQLNQEFPSNPNTSPPSSRSRCRLASLFGSNSGEPKGGARQRAACSVGGGRLRLGWCLLGWCVYIFFV